MGWLIILAVAAAAIMIYTEARMRLVLLGLLALVALTAVLFLYVFELNSEPAAPPPATSETVTNRQRTAEARAAIRRDEIMLSGITLKPRTETYHKADGSTAQRQDLSAWQFNATVRNTNTKYAVSSIAFAVGLYTCPEYVNTPQEQMETAELSQYCTRIGDRRQAFYNLDLAPGASTTLTSQLAFDNEAAPYNWRYLVEVTDIVAKVTN